MTTEYITSNKGGRKLAFENNIFIKQKVLSNGTVWGDIMGGFCPGGFCPGDFVLGGILSRGILSGGFCPGGFCLGGFCPRTDYPWLQNRTQHELVYIRILVQSSLEQDLCISKVRTINVYQGNYYSIREQSLSMTGTGADEICEKQKIIPFPL